MTEATLEIGAEQLRPRRRIEFQPVQWAGIAIIAIMLLVVIFGPFLLPWTAQEISCQPFETPSPAHPLGCNDAGQDLVAGVLTGGRVSLGVGIATALVTTLFATAVAIAAAYRGGLTDQILMRLVDVVMSLPFLPLVIVLGAFLGASLPVQVLVISLVMWAQPVRELRSQALSLRASDYVKASRAMGGGFLWVTRRHILPDLAPLIVPQFVRVAHNAILIESSLSFLGLGDPLRKSWGTILFHANARTAFLTDSWVWWILPPGVAIALAVTAFALIGYGVGERRLGKVPANTPAAGVAPEDAGALCLRKVSVTYHGDHPVPAVQSVSLDLKPGELVGLVGESGSGKSTLGMALMRLLAPAAQISGGAAWLGGRNLLALAQEDLRALRGQRIALVPQSAMNALNPVRPIGWQIAEALKLHGNPATPKRVAELLELVQIPPARAAAYPHELSGGMRQRVVIAIALANDPEVLIADEPTTGLDVLVQAGIMDLLADLRRQRGIAMLFITHDLPLITGAADRLAFMEAGRIVETGTPAQLRTGATHPHTRALFAAIPALDAAKLWQRDAPQGAPVLELQDVSQTFNAGWLARLRGGRPVAAVQDVSLSLKPGEVLGLVGGSGSGKTSTARLALGMTAPDAGTVRVDGMPLGHGRNEAAHMIFQDPYQSLRPRMRVADAVAEPLRIAGKPVDPARIREALSSVRLPSDPAFLDREVGALSGGQRQRVAFARAWVTRPRIVLADEPTSMLDQSIRLDVLGLLEEMRQSLGTAILFITHDLVLARHFCDRIAVMQEGRIVEEGPADEVALHPREPYTKRLIDAVAQ
ncbi:ATP-binding cassette domain-containing protein [Psychromarinibacter sp. S121]|uniref:ATP-binding cassette domain-containing protein n=1 Tax=Psychromarinibacter sp. S121 TaxID=3415127 RepID=UPI003C7B5B0A